MSSQTDYALFQRADQRSPWQNGCLHSQEVLPACHWPHCSSRYFHTLYIKQENVETLHTLVGLGSCPSCAFCFFVCAYHYCVWERERERVCVWSTFVGLFLLLLFFSCVFLLHCLKLKLIKRSALTLVRWDATLYIYQHYYYYCFEWLSTLFL